MSRIQSTGAQSAKMSLGEIDDIFRKALAAAQCPPQKTLTFYEPGRFFGIKRKDWQVLQQARVAGVAQRRDGNMQNMEFDIALVQDASGVSYFYVATRTVGSTGDLHGYLWNSETGKIVLFGANINNTPKIAEYMLHNPGALIAMQVQVTDNFSPEELEELSEDLTLLAKRVLTILAASESQAETRPASSFPTRLNAA